MKTKKQPPTKQVRLANFRTLCAKTWRELSIFWRPLGGVVFVYGFLYFLLVLGFNIAYTYNDIADAISADLGAGASWFSKSSLTIINLFASSGQSDAAALVQFMLFAVATLAIIWVLRQLRTLQHIRMRDAFFEGTARLVPAILVIIILLVPFIPALIGTAIFSVAQTGAVFETGLTGLLAGFLLLVSIYWFSAWLPAIYIVSLPKGTPLRAIRAAAKLTKKRRFWMVRNMLLFAIIASLIAFCVMLLFLVTVPAASVVAAYIVGFVLFGVTQIFLFVMYGELLNG